MNGLCTGSSWSDKGITFELRASHSKSTETYGIGDEIAIGFVGLRSCIGSRPPAAESLIPCPDAQVGIGGTQCKRCAERSLLLPCHICTGERCANPARRSDCVQPENHAVYIASFGLGQMKVGVAKWDRRQQRISEQGARVAMIVARDDGQLVRRTEVAIKQCGVRDRYNPKEKLAAYRTAISDESMINEIRSVLPGIKLRVDAKWLEEPEEVLLDLGHLEDHAHDFDIHDGASIRATFKRLFGSLMILETDTGSTLAIEAKEFVGWEFTELSDDQGTSGQLSIKFA